MARCGAALLAGVLICAVLVSCQDAQQAGADHDGAAAIASALEPESHGHHHKKYDHPTPVGTTYTISAIQRNLPHVTLAEQAEANRPSARKQASRDAGGPGLETQEDIQAMIKHVWAHDRRTRRRAARDQSGHSAAAEVAAAHVAHAPHKHHHYDHSYDHDHTTASVGLSFDGINAYKMRTTLGFSVDPPDQGLCVGNGFILETVNSVLRVYDAATGEPLVPALSLNVFLGVPTAFRQGFVTDPSCRFDAETKRWFHIASTTDKDVNFLAVSVSEGADPTGYWRQYRIRGANDGQDGTPNFGCNGGCVQDFPQAAVWQDALVITANEFEFDGDNSFGANVYAVDKRALLAGANAATTTLTRTGPGNSLLTLIPAIQTGHCDTPNTFLVATPLESLSLTRKANTLQLLSLEGTHTLHKPQPHVSLVWVQPHVQLATTFYPPPPDGVPQRQGVGPFGITFANDSNVRPVDASDGGMLSVSYADDRLWATWATAVGDGLAGAMWAWVDVRAPGRAVRDGVLSLPGASVIFPSLAVRPGGLGVMAVAVVGPDTFPSAGYAVVSREGVGQLTIVAPGVGPIDCFTGFLSPSGEDFAYPHLFPNRYGDYAAALVDEHGSFWVASEYVAQACSVAEYEADPTCGGTRSTFINWATRITRLELDRVGEHESR